MAEWEKKIGAINLIVGDLERAKAFYRDVFKVDLQYENEDSAHKDGSSGDVLSLAQKGVGQFVVFVEDADAVSAELDDADVTTISGPTDRDWGMRTLTLADPAGYAWEITQQLPAPGSP